MPESIPFPSKTVKISLESFSLTSKNRKSTFGGENVARSLLVSAFGDEKAEGILKKLTRQHLEKGFDYLAEIDAETLVSLIQNEHPQTIAVTLAYLPSARSAQMLQLLAPSAAKEVARRMAKMEKTSPEAVLEIARVVKKKYESSLAASRGFEAAGGMDSLVSIMSYMSGDQEKKLMDHFDRNMPDVSREYVIECSRSKMVNLSNQECVF